MKKGSDTIVESLALPKRGLKAQFTVFQIILWFVITILVGRSLYLQIFRGSTFRVEAEGNRVAALPIPAPRGVIYDQFGTPLVENVASTDLVVDPSLLPERQHEAYLIDRLPQLVPELSPEAVRAALDQARSKQRIVPLASALDHVTVLRLEEAAADVKGTRLVSSLVRKYPEGEIAAHVLGYSGAVTAEELEERTDLLPTDSTGKTGLEKFYDEILAGKHGVAYTEINAAGKPQKDLGRQEPTAGHDLHLTLDLEFQRFVHDLFRRKDEERQEKEGKPLTGAVIVLQPASGAIQALVSYPAFDPNVFSQPKTYPGATDLFTAPQNPLFNRAADGTYPPGSTIKPFLAAAALEESIITPQTTVLSTGGITVGPWQFPDWKAGGHGVSDVTKAIAESVNTFFYAISGGYEGQAGLGVEKITDYLGRFGWGERTGIDIASEGEGFLPSPTWKEAEKGEPWYIGDTYHLGIGQGDVLATPLQIAGSTATIANGGELVAPHFFEQQQARRRLSIAPTHLAVVRAGMRETVISGSGVRLSGLPVPLAGKTGTAQIGGSEETHAWFTSFGPYESPELVVTVILEKGGEGDKQAVPFAEEIWKWWIQERYKK